MSVIVYTTGVWLSAGLFRDNLQFESSGSKAAVRLRCGPHWMPANVRGYGTPAW